ncbi:MAG: DUF397 domain-containing protein [Candidatus Taylorbacteria bacterium]
MIKPFPVRDDQFKVSSWSKNNPKTCVAVAIAPQGVAIRNSNDPKRATVFFSRKEWQAFLKGAKGGEFDS